MKRDLHLKYSSLLIVFLFILTGLLLTACGGGATPKTYTIGIVNPLPLLGTTVEGFKQGMAELGYIEGKNVTYVHQEVTPMKELDAVVQDMVKAKVDLILCTTTNAAQAAQRATANTNIPVVFTSLIDPIGAGLVKSIKQPGGNITGIIFSLQEGRRLELLKQVAPTIKQIYVPYNPDDPAPVSALETISKSAPKLGVTLIPREVRNADEVEAAITNIPEEADAVFKLADSLIGARTNDLVKASIKLKLPMSAANADAVNDGTLTGYGPSASGSGKQAARLAGQILKGVKPGDLPLETSESYFSINLKTAQAINLDISDETLRQAGIIVR
jgi:putative tryptophan/tyrosine transport system substrate-binding protein